MIVRQFISWIRTASAGERAEATRALARAWLISDLTPDDRAAAEGALLMMLDDPSPLVRQAMAEVFARSSEAPAAIALIMGSIIGVGIFNLPTSLAPYGPITLVSMALTAIGALVLAVLFGALSRRLPADGGPYAYARVGFGNPLGFMNAWSYPLGRYWMASRRCLRASLAMLSTPLVSIQVVMKSTPASTRAGSTCRPPAFRRACRRRWGRARTWASPSTASS